MLDGDMRVDESSKREILSRTDLGTLIGTYVALRKRGNDLVGLCPFHGEKTPSFHVHPDKGFFKCFGCDAKGDAFTFIQLRENVTFPEALRILARRAGVELEEETPAAARVRSEKELIYAANELAATFFHTTLLRSPEAEKARAYCAERGLSAPTIESFRLGYAPDRWDGLVAELKSADIDLNVASKAGLVRMGQHGFYDFYRGRLMIPTYSTTGEVVAFGGRALDGSEPKYLNTQTTPVYTKGRGLYALERARRAAPETDAFIVVEGYLDCIALQQAGFANAVASLGTSFTPDQAGELRKYAERVFIAFDADAAGANATAKSIDILTAAGCAAFIVMLPAGEDPDTFVRAQGAAAFQARIDGAVPWVQFKLDRDIDAMLAKRLPPARAARHAEALIHGLPREEWDRWRVYAASQLGLSADDLRRSRFVQNPANFSPRENGSGFPRPVPPTAEPPSMERDVLAILLDEPALVGEYAERIPAGIFHDERYARIYRRLLESARTLATPTDVHAALGDDREAIETTVSLQNAERSSNVRFPDGIARREHLDAILERLEETDLRVRKRELSERIDRTLEAGRPLPEDDWAEYQQLVTRVDRLAGKRLGTK
jgi:DNA primase